MDEFRLRFGEPTDAPVLAAYERRYFPARAGVRHAGYAYADQLATVALTEAIAAPRRMLTLVAEQQTEIIGFATAGPFSLPGTGDVDPAHMVLQYLAVDPVHRRRGVATALVAEMERRALKARQNVIVAHISLEAADFYREMKWEVVAEDRGYAWLPFASFLRADIADPEFGFPLMAAKVLRPRAVRHAFSFPIVYNRPTLDAAAELRQIVDAGTVDVNDLDTLTRQMVNMARRGSSPQGRGRHS